MPPTIECESVTFRYAEGDVLRGVTTALEGRACGLLGANGAGKTTLLRILLGHLRPASGRVLVLGRDPSVDPDGVRRHVGYMPEEDAFLPGLSALDAVALLGELSGLRGPEAHRRAHEALHFVSVGEARYRALATLSKGMRQRVRLAQALVHDPPLILLDEPFSGLDPGGREEMAALLREIVREHGTKLLFSTHVLPDVERLCEEVLILREGEVVASGPIEELRGSGARAYLVEIEGGTDDFLASLRAAGVAAVENGRGDIRAVLPDGESTAAVFRAARSAGGLLRRLRPLRRTLEDVFADYAGEEPGDVRAPR